MRDCLGSLGTAAFVAKKAAADGCSDVVIDVKQDPSIQSDDPSWPPIEVGDDNVSA